MNSKSFIYLKKWFYNDKEYYSLVICSTDPNGDKQFSECFLDFLQFDYLKKIFYVKNVDK